MDKVLYSSVSDNWATPQYFFDELNKEFKFSLDLCANKSNAKCKKYFTKKEDSLSKTWKGNCWLNPPYGRNIIKWVKKAHESKCLVVALLPSRTDTKWFHSYIYKKHKVRFIKGRLKFGKATDNAPFPSMVVIFK